jgi:hypothetical protein
VLNAFFIMGVVVMLYAIIGVTFFADWAPAEMGNFSRAVVTLFRIAGGETWIGEPPDEGMPIINDEGFVNWGTAAFVMSFIVIVNWTLLQVPPPRPRAPAPPRPRAPAPPRPRAPAPPPSAPRHLPTANVGPPTAAPPRRPPRPDTHAPSCCRSWSRCCW